jgi:hypothetical protein
VGSALDHCVGLMLNMDGLPGSLRPAGDFAAAEVGTLRDAWAAAWLREYRCHTRYLSLLATDSAGELELRFAWLEWWDASCVCREALRRLECSQF